MTRKIVRTIVQVSAACLLGFLVVFFLDRNYRVLPTSIHEYMPQHHNGLVVTDITIKTCSSSNPFSNCKLDPEVWHKIDKDLYLRKAWFSSAFVHIRRTKEEELTAEDSVIIDIKVGKLDPTLTADKPDQQWESRPMGLWVLRSTSKQAGDSKSAVTAVDILFGDDAVEARPSWEIVGTPLLLDGGSKIPPALVTIRRGTQAEPKKPQLRIPDNGRFKILQLGDLHLSTGVGECREAVPDGYHGSKCLADPRTLDFVSRIIDDERPDLVVLSGDQVNGGTAPDAQTAIFKYARLLAEKKMPFVSIFGNHDDEHTMSRESQMALIETLPYSLSKAGPQEIDGVGNYYVEVLARGNSDHSALTIYLLDTHAYSPDERTYPGYDWLKPNQIEWFRKQAAGLRKKHSEFTLHHLDIAFIHIPIPEMRDDTLPRKGNWLEAPTAPWFNTNFRDAMVEQGVVMVSCGHDHVNDYCILSQDEEARPALWMCYAGGAGLGGYAGYGDFVRRVRIFDVDSNAGRITTWKRLEAGDIDAKIDEQVIVEAGVPTSLQE